MSLMNGFNGIPFILCVPEQKIKETEKMSILQTENILRDNIK